MGVMTPKRERFAQLAAAGDHTFLECYCIAYEKDRSTMDRDKSVETSNSARLLMRDTDVILRIQEIRRPVIRKMQKVFEYTVNDGLREAQQMYDLAYANGNEMAMGRAIELKGKFAKLLTEHVDHNYRVTVFDEMTVAALMEMKRRIMGSMNESRTQSAGNVLQITESGSSDPQAPALELA